jgi:hypothetical protein
MFHRRGSKTISNLTWICSRLSELEPAARVILTPQPQTALLRSFKPKNVRAQPSLELSRRVQRRTSIARGEGMINQRKWMADQRANELKQVHLPSSNTSCPKAKCACYWYPSFAPCNSLVWSTNCCSKAATWTCSQQFQVWYQGLERCAAKQTQQGNPEVSWAPEQSLIMASQSNPPPYDLTRITIPPPSRAWSKQ